MLAQQKVCLGSTSPLDVQFRARLLANTGCPVGQQRGAILGAIVDSARSRAFCTFASRNGFLHGFKNASRNGFYHGNFFAQYRATIKYTVSILLARQLQLATISRSATPSLRYIYIYIIGPNIC